MKPIFLLARTLCVSLCWIATASCAWSAVAPATVPAPVRDVTELMHGVTVHDPYRYMESIKDPEVQTWLRAQGDVTRQTLDRIDLRARLLQRIEEVSIATGDSLSNIVRMPGDRVYYLKRPRTERQFKLMMRVGLAGAEQVLVDPEVEAKRTGVPHAINYFTPAWDGQHVAYGMSSGGSEDASLRILNINTGKLVGAPIPRVHDALVSWLPDSRSLTYNQLKAARPGASESEYYLDSRVMWLKLGAPASKAVAVFGPTVTKNLGLARLDVARIMFAPDSRWMIARTTDTTLPEGLLFVAKAADLGKPDVAWTQISGYADQITDVALKADHLYLLTHRDAPRNRVLKLDLNQPRLALAREVARAPQNGVLEDFSLSRDALVASIREGTSIGVRRYAEGDTLGQPLAMPFAGAARLHDDAARAYGDILYTLNGWTAPARTYVFDGKRSVDAGLRTPVPAPGLPDIEITELQAPSHDGTLIPMTVLHKKGLKLDGSHPTLLNGYAAYGFSETARFSAATMVWIEQGGVAAYANARGSGVYGRDWYQAGFKATKSNTWKDGIACAQYLIQRGYASPKTLAVMGGSAGGIFAGRSATAAPEIFAAAILSVGVMDAIRAEESANGITNISEFGSAKNPKEFPALLEAVKST